VWHRRAIRFPGRRLQRVKMFLLQLGQFPDVMAFARGESEQEAGKRSEAKGPETRHAGEE